MQMKQENSIVNVQQHRTVYVNADKTGKLDCQHTTT